MVDAAILKHQQVTQQDLPSQGVNKWEVLRELSTARIAFGLSDRDMTVLQTLLSFHPATTLGGDDSLIVYPSNASICERLNGMPCSTMRRHLSHLLKAGFLVRRDSPNGKRYARRYGDEKIAFGFDLSPLVHRHAEICRAAEAIRETAERHKRLRETVSLMRRDLAGLAHYGADARPDLCIWIELTDLAVQTARALRRKLNLDHLAALHDTLTKSLDMARDILEPQRDTEELSTSARVSEQHYQNSDKDSYDLEQSVENTTSADAVPKSANVEQLKISGEARDETNLPRVPLGLILQACTECQSYTDRPIRHWHDLVSVAHIIRPMMGISPSAWEEAKIAMGPEQASVVLVAMLERFSDIHSPGGYLRSLTQKADAGVFSCAPMVMAQLRRAA